MREEAESSWAGGGRGGDQEGSVSLDSFDVLGALGTGGSSQVLLVSKKKTKGSLFAMKVIAKKDLGRKAVEGVVAENKILQSLQHPFIVGLHYAFQDVAHFYLVLSYAGGGDLPIS